MSHKQAAGEIDISTVSEPALASGKADEGDNGAEGDAGQEEKWDDEWEADFTSTDRSWPPPI